MISIITWFPQEIIIKMIYWNRQLYDYPVSQTFGAQTEFDQEMFSNPGTGTSTGTDASTQVDDKDVSASPGKKTNKKQTIYVIRVMTRRCAFLTTCFLLFFLVIRLWHWGDADSRGSDSRCIQDSYARSAVRRRTRNEGPATKGAVHAAQSRGDRNEKTAVPRRKAETSYREFRSVSICSKK